MKYNQRYGFTLIELSIVLVIIGLIVGGVLMGRDLINAAEIRQAVSTIEKYQTATNTFRVKYNGLPGDLNATDAVELGFQSRSDHGTGVINNNQILESTDDDVVNTSTTDTGHEIILFWRDLSEAQLIKEHLYLAVDGLIPVLMFGIDPLGQVRSFFPELDIGSLNFVTAYSSLGQNYFSLASIQTVSAGDYALGYGLTPNQAFSIDNKIDDGLPLSGVVRGNRSATTLGVACDPSANANNGDACCGDEAGGNANQYKTVSDSFADGFACQLSIKFQ